MQRGYTQPLILCLLLLSMLLAMVCDTQAASSGNIFLKELTPADSTPVPVLGKLAYVHEGDIWARSLPDGEPRRLTTDGGNRGPLWSFSGQWLGFRKGEQAWVIHAEKDKAWTLNSGAGVGSIAWSPIEDRLAYVTSSGDLWASNADGSGSVELVAIKPAPTLAPGMAPTTVGRIAWSPDGQWLAYDVYRVLKASVPPERYAGLWRIRADGSGNDEVYTMGSPASDGIILAGWSPDGQSLLFWPQPLFSASILADGVPLQVISAAGGEPRQVVPQMLLHSDFLAVPPHGDVLAVVSGAGRETWTNKHVVAVDVVRRGQAQLTDDLVAAVSPDWSPDGRHIVYVAAPDVGSVDSTEALEAGVCKRRVWVMNSDGSGKRQMTDDAAYRDERPLWSADGRDFLFARIDRNGRASLWLMPALGGTARQISDELTPTEDWFGHFGHVSWGSLFDWWRGSAR